MSDRRRPPTPQHVKDLVWDREKGFCEHCKQRVEERSHAEYEHRPALWLRARRMEFPPSSPRHYMPNANDPQHIQLLHGKKSGLPCHQLRTFGNGLDRGDVSNSARSKRILEKAFSRTTAAGYSMLKSDREQPVAQERPKRKLQSRGFPPKGSRKIQSRPMRSTRRPE